MFYYLSTEKAHNFDRVQIYTDTNRSSVISDGQYQTYCRILGMKESIRKSEGG